MHVREHLSGINRLRKC